MGKMFGIIGTLFLSTIFFLMSNNIRGGESLDLESLMTLNSANGEDGSGSHKCYDSFVLGTTYISINCNGCKSQRNAQFLDPSTCP